MAADPDDAADSGPADERPDAPPLSWRRLRWALTLDSARRAEEAGRFEQALERLEAAARIKALWPEHRVWRAWLLLRAQRLRESQDSFASLRKAFQGSDDPDLQYLRHFCTAMLGMLRVDAAPMAYAARQAREFPCRASLRRKFPLVAPEDGEES